MRNPRDGVPALFVLSVLFISSLPSALARPIPFSAPGADDQARELSDLKFRSLAEMEKARLQEGALPESPWSDDYWPIYQGVIARRYADQDFPASGDWRVNRDYALKSVSSTQIDALSPAEKYDLLVGDSDRELTRGMWEIGEEYYELYNKVETWMGICDGWSGASIMVPRPTQGVTVTAADGVTQIHFYPSDIKALASLLWAKAPGPTRLISARCNTKNPKRDSKGRIIDPACRDTNPASWHLAVVNLIGAEKQGLVMDASYSYEVWNHPLYAYKYSLINPITGVQTVNLKDAKVLRFDYRTDPYARWRAPSSIAIVGVSMDVTYVAENAPNTADDDSPLFDQRLNAHYAYDLELDERERIVGGEWHQPDHPDFLWAPESGGVASSAGDLDLDHQGDQSQWNGKAPLPTSWAKAARLSSQRKQPLERIVTALVTLSRLGI